MELDLTVLGMVLNKMAWLLLKYYYFSLMEKETEVSIVIFHKIIVVNSFLF